MIGRLTPLSKRLTPLLANLYNARVVKDFFIYSFGSLLLRGISILIVPLIMRTLAPAQYGALSLVTAFNMIVTAIIGLGLRQLLSIEYFHYQEQERKQLINEMILLYSCIAIPTVILCWHIKTVLIRYLFFDTISDLQLLPALLSLVLFFYAELFYQLMQYERKASQLTILQIMVALITSGSTFYALWILHTGIEGILWAQFLGQLCAFLFGLYAYIDNDFYSLFYFSIPTKQIRYYFQYGLPFIPGIICSWILASSDRWMLGYYCTMREVGIYSVADLFAQIFYSLILVPWSGSYLPYIMKQYKQHEASLFVVEKENQRIMWLSMIALVLIISVGLMSCSPFLTYVLPPLYQNALSYIPFLLMGQIFLLGSYFASALIQFKKQTSFLAVALTIPALLNIALNYLLVSPLGILGCSIATLISYLAYFIITLVYNKKIAR